MLQCVAACCSVLQRVAACCSVLQCSAIARHCHIWLFCTYVGLFCGNVGLFTIAGDCRMAHRVCCSVLQCVAACCSVLQLLGIVVYGALVVHSA